MNSNNNNVPSVQRALVLQGGGALGAYEVGALKALCDNLMGMAKCNEQEQLFDIVAATSIGAMNAAVLVSNVINRKKKWKEAVEELEKFWTGEKDGLSSTPDFSKWWRNDGSDQNKAYALDEALRKYYSVKEYLIHGTPRVCTALLPRPDLKFGDQKDNLWICHTIQPLEDTIVRYSINPGEKMRIATSWDNHQQQTRLLVIAVDVKKGKTITFDSYHKKGEDPSNPLYDCDGISIDQIMASGTLPEFYDFRIIGGRQFCDGGLLSNTPFRELLQAHQEYWLKIIDRDKQKIPDLEIYIINDHPSRGTTVPKDDHDGVVDRINDIKFLDRNSHYDENAFNAITDHVTIIDKLKDLAKIYITPDKLNEFENDYKKFLKLTKAKSKLHPKEDRMYRDVLDSRFGLTKVIRIENMDYKDSISGKTADFTSKSIRDLIALGYSDALKCLNIKTGVEKSKIYRPEIIR